MKTTWMARQGARPFALLSACLFLSLRTYAQDGNSGIEEANTLVRGYFDSGTQLMYAVGAILGLIGAVKVLCAVNGVVA